MVVVKWFQFHGSLFEKIGTIWCLIANWFQLQTSLYEKIGTIWRLIADWFQFTSGCSCEMEPNQGTPLIWLHVRPGFCCRCRRCSRLIYDHIRSYTIIYNHKKNPLRWMERISSLYYAVRFADCFCRRCKQCAFAGCCTTSAVLLLLQQSSLLSSRFLRLPRI